MENDENIKHKKRRDSKSTLLSVLGVEDAKNKLKNIAQKRRGTISEENQGDSSNKGEEKSLLQNLKATLADLKAVEAERQETGLQQLEQKKKLNIKIGATLMTSKAIAIMSSSRKQKMKASVNVSQS